MADKLLRPQFESAPKDWHLVPLKSIMEVTSGKEVPVEIRPGESAVPVYGSGTDPFKYTDRPISSKPSILFGRKGTLGQPYLVQPPFWAVDTAYIANSKEGVELRYLYFLLLTFDWKPFVTNTAKPSLVANDVMPEKVPLPPPHEQKLILCFLDHKTAEIDGLIEKMARQVELLERYRRELIARTVTRGLDPDVPLKDSGIDWIGEVPLAWEIKRAKALFFQRKEKSTEADVHLTPSQINGVLPQEEYIRMSGTKPVLNLSAPNNMKHVEIGDFIIHLRSFQGGIELSNYAGKVSNAYTVISVRQGGDKNYYRWLLKSPPFIAKLSSLTDQLRDGQSINFKTFSHMFFPLPPISEQRRIADFLNKTSEGIDPTIEGINKQIELLGEYRKQVINDAVTGKVRVGEVA